MRHDGAMRLYLAGQHQPVTLALSTPTESEAIALANLFGGVSG